jgi:fatty acid desaturase
MNDESLDAKAHILVRDLHAPRPGVFWADMIASAVLGWAAFISAVYLPLFSPVMFVACLVSALALYRGLCFTHELTHLRNGSIPGFETAWNLLFGIPFLLPSFTYIGVHQYHHNLSTYGTKDDPEYLPFASSPRMIWVFALQSSLVLPLLLLIRFLIVAPVGLVWSRFHLILEERASSFAMNPLYRRRMSTAQAQSMRRWEIAMLLACAIVFGLMYAGTLPVRALAVWYVVIASVCTVNTLRVLVAHRYESSGEPRDRPGQLQDSLDHPGGWLTGLWAPVGLRYHALHHYFPGIPYHNLGLAYRRLIRSLPNDAPYRDSTTSTVWGSLARLYRRAKRSHSEVSDQLNTVSEYGQSSS